MLCEVNMEVFLSVCAHRGSVVCVVHIVAMYIVCVMYSVAILAYGLSGAYEGYIWSVWCICRSIWSVR